MIKIRYIEEDDIELLREWKNKNRGSFFHKDIIDKEQQKAWFHSYSDDDNDHMFMVLRGDKPIGCIGFRLFDDEIDLYNLIVDGSARGNGYMSFVLCKVIEKIEDLGYEDLPITAKVLNSNPALQWYFNNFFALMENHKDYTKVVFLG